MGLNLDPVHFNCDAASPVTKMSFDRLYDIATINFADAKLLNLNHSPVWDVRSSFYFKFSNWNRVSR